MEMKPKIKLTYFNITGRGEPIRLALSIGKIEFEDNRIEFKDWARIKETTPYGSLPILTLNGEDIDHAQSNAILRYVGKLTNLYPEDELDALIVDEIIDTIGDNLQGLFTYEGADKEKLKEVRQAWIKESFPRYLGGLDKRIMNIGDGKGPFVLGDRVTIADLLIANFMNTCAKGKLEHVDAASVEQFSRLIKIRDSVWDIAAQVKN